MGWLCGLISTCEDCPTRIAVFGVSETGGRQARRSPPSDLFAVWACCSFNL